MAKGLNVKFEVRGAGLMAKALKDARKRIKHHMRRAIREAMKPPPPGMRRIRISLLVTEALLEDEPALAGFLLSSAKRYLAND